MTIKELDDKLNTPGFQDTENGDLTYNFFIYQYPAEKEYDIRRQIQEFKRVCHKSMAHPLLCYLLYNPRSIVAYSKKGII